MPPIGNIKTNTRPAIVPCKAAILMPRLTGEAVRLPESLQELVPEPVHLAAAADAVGTEVVEVAEDDEDTGDAEDVEVAVETAVLLGASASGGGASKVTMPNPAGECGGMFAVASSELTGWPGPMAHIQVVFADVKFIEPVLHWLQFVHRMLAVMVPFSMPEPAKRLAEMAASYAGSTCPGEDLVESVTLSPAVFG
jgi:hypothetical protein